MSKNALAFIAGLGTGYLTQSERNKDRARQAKKDAQDEEIHTAKMDEYRDKRKEKTALADAGAERTAMAGTAVDTGAGKNLYTDPAQATAAAEDASIENEMRGEMAGTAAKPVQTMAANGITGNMATGHKITTDPVDLANLNSPDARTQRTTAALYGLGKPVEAMQLEAGAKQAKIADIQLSDAKWKNDIGQAMQGGHEGLAKLITNSQAGVMKGVTLNVVPSADGKTVTYNKVAPDGTVTPGMTFTNDQDGVIKAGYMLDKSITPENRMDHYTKAKQADQAQANLDRTFKLTESHQKVMEDIAKGNLSIHQMTASLAKAKDGREQTLFDNETKIPQAEKIQLASITKHMDIMEKAMADAKAKGEWNPSSEGSRELMTQYERASAKYTKIITPFMGSSKRATGPGDDPLNLKAPPAVQPTAKPAAGAAAPAGVARPVIPAPAPAPAAPAAEPKQINTVDQIQADNIAALAPLAAQYKQAEQQMVMAAKSGDQRALATYMQAKEVLRAQLEKQVSEKFGNTAPAVLKQLYAQ